jgi:hypothetical protein
VTAAGGTALARVFFFGDLLKALSFLLISVVGVITFVSLGGEKSIFLIGVEPCCRRLDALGVVEVRGDKYPLVGILCTPDGALGDRLDVDRLKG